MSFVHGDAISVPKIDRRDLQLPGVDLSTVLKQARVTITERDITTQDLRDDALVDLRDKVLAGEVTNIPDYLWDWLGLPQPPNNIVKEVKVAAQKRAADIAAQQAAQVRIRLVC